MAPRTSLTAVNVLPILYSGYTEVAMCLVAASIPVLRVLVRDKASTARRYYHQKGVTTTSKNNTVVVVSTQQQKNKKSKRISRPDDLSDFSGTDEPAGPGRVLMTNEVSVNYRDRKEDDSIGGGYVGDRV